MRRSREARAALIAALSQRAVFRDTRPDQAAASLDTEAGLARQIRELVGVRAKAPWQFAALDHAVAVEAFVETWRRYVRGRSDQWDLVVEDYNAHKAELAAERRELLGLLRDGAPRGAAGSSAAAAAAAEAAEAAADAAADAATTVGPVGPAGRAGQTSQAGSTDPAGQAGWSGQAGPAGSPGPAGPVGWSGQADPAGSPSPFGPAGWSGPAGPAGSPSPAHRPGLSDSAGASAQSGPAGRPGPGGVPRTAGPGNPAKPAAGSTAPKAAPPRPVGPGPAVNFRRRRLVSIAGLTAVVVTAVVVALVLSQGGGGAHPTAAQTPSTSAKVPATPHATSAATTPATSSSASTPTASPTTKGTKISSLKVGVTVDDKGHAEAEIRLSTSGTGPVHVTVTWAGSDSATAAGTVGAVVEDQHLLAGATAYYFARYEDGTQFCPAAYLGVTVTDDGGSLTAYSSAKSACTPATPTPTSASSS